jgi:opacity protein-like surface antigen
MRRFALALIVAASATPAAAADPAEFLRGAIMDGVGGPRVEWGGYYVGAHAATGAADFNFRESVALLTSALTLGKYSNNGSAIGGFAGYNAQWDAAVLGVEVNYSRGNYDGLSSAVAGSGGTLNITTASMHISDMGSARLRAGWTAGMFMPYVFGGVSMGRGDITRTVTVGGALVDARYDNGHYLYGYAAGAGVDVMLFGNVFLRGEWEYLKFTSPVDASVSTVRAGLGWRF